MKLYSRKPSQDIQVQLANLNQMHAELEVRYQKVIVECALLRQAYNAAQKENLALTNERLILAEKWR